MPEREMRVGEPLRLLSVCRLVPKKGIDVVLRALAMVRSEVHYHYRICGAGPELPRLRALTRELQLENVDFVGPISPAAVAAELAQADVFALGTRRTPDGDRDGLPNALLEAMAAGVPVIASDAGAVSEVVQHRRTGWLPPPDRPREFADALREVALDRVIRWTVAVNAHAEIRRRFSSELSPSLLALRIAGEISTTINAQHDGGRRRSAPRQSPR
jgi:glycosyltransferase involved in cell wall biosynthesis